MMMSPGFLSLPPGRRVGAPGLLSSHSSAATPQSSHTGAGVVGATPGEQRNGTHLFVRQAPNAESPKTGDPNPGLENENGRGAGADSVDGQGAPRTMRKHSSLVARGRIESVLNEIRDDVSARGVFV